MKIDRIVNYLVSSCSILKSDTRHDRLLGAKKFDFLFGVERIVSNIIFKVVDVDELQIVTVRESSRLAASARS